MFDRLAQMLIKEFIQVFRDPKTRFLVLLVPVIQLVLFGYAVNTDVRHVPLAVRDSDNTAASRKFSSRFMNTEWFVPAGVAGTDSDVDELIDNNRAKAVIRIAHGFEDDLRSGRTAAVQLFVDGVDSISAGMVLDYAGKIVERYSMDVLAERQRRIAGVLPTMPGIDLQTRAWFNENLDSRNFYLPGVIALLVTLITLLLTSLAVVREKEMGTIEQIMVTPMSRTEFILGKTLPFAVIGLCDVLLIVLVACFWFEIPLRGSVTLLFASSGLYLLTMLGVGLLISTVSETQQQAVMTTFFFFFPAVMLSGFVFPIANMPEPVQWVTYLNPLRYFLRIIRGIFLKGVGVDVLWPQLAGLAVIGVVVMTLAIRRFKKTLV